MPEGPEVRKYADALHAALSRRAIVSFEAVQERRENGFRKTRNGLSVIELSASSHTEST